MKPTMVVGVDFLFWFCCKHDRLTEPHRLELCDRGLKLLESVPCPLIVGDIPDALGGHRWHDSSESQVPARNHNGGSQSRLVAWASGRPLVSVVKISNLMRSIGTGQEIVLHGKAVAQDHAQHGFQSGCICI